MPGHPGKPWWQFLTWPMTITFWLLVVAAIVVLVVTFPPLGIAPYKP